MKAFYFVLLQFGGPFSRCADLELAIFRVFVEAIRAATSISTRIPDAGQRNCWTVPLFKQLGTSVGLYFYALYVNYEVRFGYYGTDVI